MKIKKWLIIALIIIYGCSDTHKKTKKEFEGFFTNMITGYQSNCETVIQELKITDNTFQYKRFCQTETNRIFDSTNGFVKRMSDLSFILFTNDSTKKYQINFKSDSVVSLIINPGQKNEFESELKRINTIK